MIDKYIFNKAIFFALLLGIFDSHCSNLRFAPDISQLINKGNEDSWLKNFSSHVTCNFIRKMPGIISAAVCLHMANKKHIRLSRELFGTADFFEIVKKAIDISKIALPTTIADTVINYYTEKEDFSSQDLGLLIRSDIENRFDFFNTFLTCSLPILALCEGNKEKKFHQIGNKEKKFHQIGLRLLGTGIIGQDLLPVWCARQCGNLFSYKKFIPKEYTDMIKKILIQYGCIYHFNKNKKESLNNLAIYMTINVAWSALNKWFANNIKAKNRVSSVAVRIDLDNLEVPSDYDDGDAPRSNNQGGPRQNGRGIPLSSSTYIKK